MSSQRIIEKERLFTNRSPEVDAIESYLKRVAKTLYPQSDEIEFRLIDSPHIDAKIYSLETPPVVAISIGLLNFVKTEDELAWVIGHELGHNEMRKFLGPMAATKGEEASADIISMRRLIATKKYNARAGMEFMERLEQLIEQNGGDKASVLGTVLEAAFDPHPENKSRWKIMNDVLAFETTQNVGKVNTKKWTEYDPLVGKSVGTAKHVSFIEHLLPADYDRWPAAVKLDYLSRGFEQSLSDDDTLTSIRLPQLWSEVDNLSNPANAENTDYRNAATAFANSLEKADPLNQKGWFDEGYEHIARSLSPNTKLLPPIGPFAELFSNCTKLYHYGLDLAAAQQNEKPTTEQIDTSAKKLARSLNKARPYYLNGDVPSIFASFNADLTDPKLKNNKSSVIRKTMLAGFAHPKLRTALYPCATVSTDAARAIWQLGAGYDPNFWNAIGPEKVQKFRNLRPLNSGSAEIEYDYEFDRQIRFDELNDDIARWMSETVPNSQPALSKPEAGLSEASIRSTPITDYMYKNYAQLFPPDPDASILQNGKHQAAQDFTSFVIKKFKEAPPEQRDELIEELSGFYDKTGQWLQSQFDPWNTFNETKYFPVKHPYVQLCLETELGLPAKTAISFVKDIVEPRKLDLNTARRLCQFEKQTSIAKTIDQFDPFLKEIGPDSFAANTIADELTRIIHQKGAIGLGDPELLALFEVTPDNPRFNDQASKIASTDLLDALSEALWTKPKSTIPHSLAKASPRHVVALYRFLERHQLFPSHQERAIIGDVLLQKLKQAPASEREDLCEKMLFLAEKHKSAWHSEKSHDTYLTANLHLRDELVNLWKSGLTERFGLDDGTNDYAEKVGHKVDVILHRASGRDKTLLLEALADTLVIQKPLANKITEGLKPTKEFFQKTHKPFAAIEGALTFLTDNEPLRLAYIDYLSQPFSQPSLESITGKMLASKGALKKYFDYLEVDYNEYGDLPPKQKRILSNSLQDLHIHFANSSLELRVAGFSSLLVPPKVVLEEDSYRKAYALVMSKAFPESGEKPSPTREFVQAFLNASDKHEKLMFVSAMLAVATESDSAHATSIPEQAVKVMGQLGPAFIKLGQAINSHPQCAPDWKEATGKLKSAAKTKPRWKLISDLEKLLQDSGQSIKWFGPILGSASFNTAMRIRLDNGAIGRDAVALIARDNAADLAESGFDRLQKTIENWTAKEVAPFRRIIGEMIQEARELAAEETSRTVNNEQFELAKELYGTSRQIVVKSGKQKIKVNINPVKSLYDNEGIRLLSYAEGVHFNDLPFATKEEKTLKRAIAKAYLYEELSHILSGKQFDCDRHGKQLNVHIRPDGEVDLNLYDFGGLALREPSDEQKKALGFTLKALMEQLVPEKNEVKATLKGLVLKDTHAEKREKLSLEQVLENAIGAAEGDERKYLMRTRKALLALNDFIAEPASAKAPAQPYLTPLDFLQVLSAINIDKGILEQMPGHKLLKPTSQLLTLSGNGISVKDRPNIPEIPPITPTSKAEAPKPEKPQPSETASAEDPATKCFFQRSKKLRKEPHRFEKLNKHQKLSPTHKRPEFSASQPHSCPMPRR